jgi:[pyruvate, water dikinase]-phosphate phosphotransferase / [pyruvate, water dikinase] kinase
MLTVFVVSDATGETAQRVVRSALVQFAEADVELVRRGQVRSAERIRTVVGEAAERGAIVLHTLVADELRRLMLAECRLKAVDSLDILGPVLDRLARHLQLAPQEKPGLFQQLVEARSREIEAVDFAFHHDDGQNTDDLERAEVVLVGISRTMKTPTMLYLAYRGWFAANVPLVPECAVPRALLSVPAERVFCLTMATERLIDLRRTRAIHEAIPLEPYTSPEAVRKEIAYAERMCLKHGWEWIEVTGKSVEEVAREIITLLSAL